MTGTPQIKVNLDELPLDHSKTGSRFECSTGEIGMALGLTRLGAMLHVVPAGKTAFPFHRHHGSDEMFFIVSGTGQYRTDEGIIDVKPGDCLGAPAGGIAHQIINNSGEELRYIGLSNNGTAELVEYPDSGNVLMSVGTNNTWYDGATFKARAQLTPVSYWDGEDIGEEE